MKEREFIKLNLKFEMLNFCANVKVKITRTAVRQLANTLTVREFSKWIVTGNNISAIKSLRFFLKLIQWGKNNCYVMYLQSRFKLGTICVALHRLLLLPLVSRITTLSQTVKNDGCQVCYTKY
jgi:hypothetical protein